MALMDIIIKFEDVSSSLCVTCRLSLLLADMRDFLVQKFRPFEAAATFARQ